jgi:hypothetical protein
MKTKLLITLLAFAPVVAFAQTSIPPSSSAPSVSVGSISNPNTVNTNMNISNPNNINTNTNISNPNNVNTYISNPNNVNTNYTSINAQEAGNNSGNSTGNGNNSGNVSVGNTAVVIVAPAD